MNSGPRDAPLLSRLLPTLQVLSLVRLLFAALRVAAVSGPWVGATAMVGVVYVAAIPVVAALWIVRSRQSSERARMVLLCFGVALGSALRSYQQAHARDQQELAERDEAMARLEEAITRLRRTAEIEKELLLADERARSGRELHDRLGHRLTLISMGLEFARRTRDDDPENSWIEVATADATARETLTEMRTWGRALIATELSA